MSDAEMKDFDEVQQKTEEVHLPTIRYKPGSKAEPTKADML